MQATDLLKTQHEAVRALFARLEQASEREAKAKLFHEIATHLVAHDAIEREIFYPACEARMGMSPALGEALVEHGVIEFCLFQSDQAVLVAGSEEEDEFEYKCTVLKEIVEHHVREEENEFFPRVEAALGAARLEELTESMLALFEECLQGDFRDALYTNLEQVIAGVVKTSSSDGRESTRRPRRAV